MRRAADATTLSSWASSDQGGVVGVGHDEGQLGDGRAHVGRLGLEEDPVLGLLRDAADRGRVRVRAADAELAHGSQRRSKTPAVLTQSVLMRLARAAVPEPAPALAWRMRHHRMRPGAPSRANTARSLEWFCNT